MARVPHAECVARRTGGLRRGRRGTTELSWSCLERACGTPRILRCVATGGAMGTPCIKQGVPKMTAERSSSREIDGKGRSVRELLAGRKYSIDYYQREYKWQTKHVAELIDDLAAKFLESHEKGNERSAVSDYGHYFLGSIIISDKDGQKFIIDGQQRLTTLTLLLIFLQHQLQDAEQHR